MMSIEKYLEKMKNMQSSLLLFLDNEDNSDENFQSFKYLYKELKICKDQHEFKSFLALFLRIANNHHHAANFYNKIDQLLHVFKDDMKKKFSNREIFDIFKKNKRILLFLFEEKVVTIDEYIISKISGINEIQHTYNEYFSPEIKAYQKEQLNEIQDYFYEKRKIGENDNLICKLIREDLIDDFIVYINEHSISLNSTIERSIFEANSFLLNSNKIQLINYAAFFGSIKDKKVQEILFMKKKDNDNKSSNIEEDIFISNDMIDVLHENRSLSSIELQNELRSIPSIYFDIQYPTANFERIYSHK